MEDLYKGFKRASVASWMAVPLAFALLALFGTNMHDAITVMLIVIIATTAVCLPLFTITAVMLEKAEKKEIKKPIITEEEENKKLLDMYKKESEEDANNIDAGS